MIQFQENTHNDGRTEGRTDLFPRIFLVTVWGLTSTTAVDWYLKVKDLA